MWCSRSGERCSDRGGARRILNTGTEAAISEWRRAFALGFCAQLVTFCAGACRGSCITMGTDLTQHQAHYRVLGPHHARAELTYGEVWMRYSSGVHASVITSNSLRCKQVLSEDATQLAS